MQRFSLLLSFGLLGFGLVNSEQFPFRFEDRDPRETYEFQWSIHKVAVIGAGAGGLLTYRELSQSGFDVHVFERDHAPGGNWHYSDQTPVDAPVPNVEPAIADYDPWIPQQTPFEEVYEDESYDAALERVRRHRGPKAIWASMTANTPSKGTEIREFPWPRGTPLNINHTHISRYLRGFASWHSINANDDGPIAYNTRVEKVVKRADGKGWTLTLKRLIQVGEKTCRAVWYTQDFDAVVIASGRYNAPFIPDVEGLDLWVKKFPESVLHSRQYRRPEPLRNETVLIVGAGPSAIGISRDINPFAKQIYQSIRPRKDREPYRELQLTTLPVNTTRIPGLKRFIPGDSPSEGIVELENGNVITGIDHIIFGTGFRYTYPYIPQYHERKQQSAQAKPLVTDGTHVQSLFLDLFYIEEPTLGIMNVNEKIPTFQYPELAAQALAKVWAGHAKLPSTRDQWRLHDEYVQARGGYGPSFQALPKDVLAERRRFFVGWLNDAAYRHGGRQVTDIDTEDELLKIWIAAKIDNNIQRLESL